MAIERGKKDGPWDVIIVGSGMGGMACAAALAKYGRRVLVLEQHYVAGGFTHTFSRKGYHWDVGVHCLGEMEPNRAPGKLIDWLSDGRVRMNKLGDLTEIFLFPDGMRFEMPASSSGFQRNLEKLFPDEKPAIAKYMQLVREAAKAAKPHFMMRMAPRWVDTVASPVVERKSRKWWMKTTAEVLADLTSNERLRAVLAGQWGYYGSPPSRSSFFIHAVTIRHFWNGGYYPVGGASVIAESFLDVVRKAGGDVRLRTTVEEVIVRKGVAVGVRIAGGEEIRAPIVVSAAGARTTVEKLLPERIREDAWAREIRSLDQSPAHLCLNIGFEGDIAAAGATAANQWFVNTWDVEWEEWDLDDPKSIAPLWYVSFPTLKDPAHDPGPSLRHTGEAVTFVPWKAFEKWKSTRRGFREKDYTAFKKGIEERTTAQLWKWMPKVMDLVKYQELSTPLSTAHFTRAPEGAIYGLEPTPRRFGCKGLRTRTPVKGLYLSGADVATLGVVGALMGGIMTASTLEPRVMARLR